MAFVTSPNMLLTIPGVGTEAGPTYALDINTSLTLVDQHDHSLGKGVQITPAGININTVLNFNNNNLTAVQGIVFQEQNSLPTTLQYLYVSPGVETPLTEDLWFNDGNGNQVQITNNGLVNATIASIPGESYAGGTFFWKQGALSTVPANFDIGSIVLRPNVAATTFGVQLIPPTGITSQYDISLPLLPLVNSILFIDASGIMTTSQFIPNGSIAANSIDGSKIITNSLDGTKIIDHTVGLTQLATTVLQTNTATFTITTPSFNVRVATTVNGTLGTAFANGQTVDGVVLATNDIILLKNQTTTTDDGVYIVQATGTPVRHTSYDTFTELNYAGVHVTAGTTNINTNWFQNNILTSLASPQSWSQSSTQMFTVPANVNQIIVMGSGGGGGAGGSAGGTVGSGGPGGGGGGGAGSTPQTQRYTVTPGDIINVKVGFMGLGGAGGGTGANGVAGTAGASSTVSGTTVSFTVSGGAAGAPGLSVGSGSTGGAGGTTYSPNNYAGIIAGAAGSGGNASTAGSASFISALSGTAAAGGTAPSTGGGGGAGGPSWGIGGAGANGGVANGNGNIGNAAANEGAGGGGAGGGSTDATGTVGRAGGNGASGKVIIQWLGAP